MKIYLLGFTLLIIANSATTLSITNLSQCSCEYAQQQADCLTDYCTWDPNESTCTNKPCSGFSEDDCQSVPDPFNCAWNYTTNKCETLTKCSDYTFKQELGFICYDLVKCQVDVDTIDNVAGTVKCTDRTHDSALSIKSCDNIPYERCRWQVISDGKQCVKNTTAKTCETKLITQCSEYPAQEACNIFSCYWSDTCKPQTCSALTDEESCTFFYSIDGKSATICKWDAGKCTDLDTTILTQAQCLPYTRYSYIWNPDTEKCEICQEGGFSSGLLLYGSFLLAIMLN